MGDSILTGQQAEQITNRIERLKTKVDAVNLKVARTTETLNNLAETGLPEVPFVPTPTTSPGVNVALGKTAFQTTTQGYHTPATGEQYPGDAGRAVDGNTDGYLWDNSCTHTKAEHNPTWWVDLGQSYPINRVVIFNRHDQRERLNPFNIHIGGSSQVTANPKCGGDHRMDINKRSISISCQEMVGRYVGVRLAGSQSRALTLCEVQVFSNSESGSNNHPGYTERDGSFYKVFRYHTDHASAQQTCEADGGHLADVKTEAVNNFIVELISATGIAGDYWIGLNDKAVSKVALQ
ncbi:hypothetical protein Bbelb_189000 [Branchiostoma belcheri]|nr:hypothetical protein Bbelb_189000 [Branchiostoma belcheri]